MKNVAYFMALILGCYGIEFRGYNYPKPSCPLQPPVTYTETATQTVVFSTENTVFQTVVQTSTVAVPTYITTTDYEIQTSTVYITPSPVTQYSTVINTVTACVQEKEQDSAILNQYLPPISTPPPVLTEEGSHAEVDRTYLPPDTSGRSSATNDINDGNVLNLSASDSDGNLVVLRRSAIKSTPNDARRARYLLNLGALPPLA
ncbi:uncharacterized protein LOC129750814 [Uranotaenia lowii]|uniref:uncharacterized protein LOC129750814 n=1 Tax=Uranotaenia lowii TaxID=190385 RepID=UPI002478601D|nr:uncharacterized protein LOC129750814 [Uranotaenia lowii]